MSLTATKPETTRMPVPENELIGLSNAYQQLKHQRDQLATSAINTSRHLEHLMLSVLDSYEDALCGVAWRASEVEAIGSLALCAKAKILRDWVGHEQDDLVDQLSNSVCRDIDRMMAQTLARMPVEARAP